MSIAQQEGEKSVPNRQQPVAAAKRWMEFAITCGIIVTSTVGSVWALMVYALDNEYVQIESFNSFKIQISNEIKGVAAEISCDSMRQKVMDLNTVIAFKKTKGEDPSLEVLLRENQIEALQGSPKCRVIHE